MERYTQQDLRAFSSCLLTLYTSQRDTPFSQQVLGALPALIAADSFLYVVIDFHTPSASSVVLTPASLSFPGESQAIVTTVIQEHPIVQYWQQTGENQALMLSDFLSRRRYHHLTLYQAYYQPMAIEHQLAVRLPSTPRRQIAVVLNRARHAFSAHDRAFLNLLCPHMWSAAQKTRVLHQLRQATCPQESESPKANRTVLVQSGNGRPLEWTQPAWEVVRDYLPMSSRHPQRLPDELQQWMQQQQTVGRQEAAAQQPRVPRYYSRAGRRLIVHYLEELGEPALLLEEQQEQHMEEAWIILQGLGLTPRQAEVLFWVAQGKTNQDIAAILQMQRDTVRTHLQGIYQRLGVENRTAAARCALELMSGHIF
jgi:DNA-binding CsgD family transcriptional regulator